MNHLEKEPFEDINVNGARIRLVGTAHVSQASTDFVIEQIEKGSYDCVAVELCASRCQQLMEPEAVYITFLFNWQFKLRLIDTISISLDIGSPPFEYLKLQYKFFLLSKKA